MGGRSSGSGLSRSSVSPYTGMELEQLKEIRRSLQEQARTEFGGRSELDENEVARFSELMAQRDSVEYEIFNRMSPAIKQENLDKRNAERGAQTDLNSAEIAVARTDLLKNRDYYMAIQNASHGIAVQGNRTADTEVDRLYNQNPDKFYRTFNNTRKMLRQKYGDTVTLYRSPTGQTPKATVNMTSLRSNAAQYGDRVISVKVPVKDVLAVNVSRTGQYEEFIVLNRSRRRY